MSAAPIRVKPTPTQIPTEGPEATASPAAGPSTANVATPARAPAGSSFLSVASLAPRSEEGPHAPRAEASDPSTAQRPDALSQRARGVEATLARITERLSRSLLDPAITDADVRSIQRELEGLSKPAFGEVLRALDAKGLLATLIAEQDPGVRRDFVAQLEDARIFERRPSRPMQGLLAPPDGPGMLEVSRDAPDPLRRLGHEENLRIAVAFDAQRRAYIERYIGKVNEARSPGELAVLGPPVSRTSTSLAGLPDLGLAARAQLTGLLGHRDDTRALRALNNRKAVLAGVTPPGHFGAQASAEVQLGAATANATLSVGEAGAALRGMLGLQQGPVCGSVAMDRAFAGASSPGAPATPARLLQETGTTFGVKASGGKGMKAASAELASDGTLKLGLGAGAVSANPRTGAASVGVGHGLEVPGAKVKGEVRLNFQFSDPRNAPAVANGPGMAPPPPELLAQSPWSMLPPERQQALANQRVRRVYWDSLMPELPKL